MDVLEFVECEIQCDISICVQILAIFNAHASNFAKSLNFIIFIMFHTIKLLLKCKNYTNKMLLHVVQRRVVG